MWYRMPTRSLVQVPGTVIGLAQVELLIEIAISGVDEIVRWMMVEFAEVLILDPRKNASGKKTLPRLMKSRRLSSVSSRSVGRSSSLPAVFK